MADTGKPDGTSDGPSLEMPSLSLRRRKKTPEAAAVPEPAAQPAAGRSPEPLPEGVAPTTAVTPVIESEPEPPTDPRPRRELPTIALAGLPAAGATGVAVGALAVALAWLSTTACDVVRGTSSCGGGPGLVILVAVLVLLAWAGSLLLRVLGVADAGSTSILAVGILAVLVLVFLLGSIDEWWMVIAIPVAAVIAYAASWWVTHAVMDEDFGVDTSSDDRAPRDVR